MWLKICVHFSEADRLGDPCQIDVQCNSKLSIHSECVNNACQCKSGSHFDEGRCYQTSGKYNKLPWDPAFCLTHLYHFVCWWTRGRVLQKNWPASYHMIKFFLIHSKVTENKLVLSISMNVL